jgi:antitoxin VapB
MVCVLTPSSAANSLTDNNGVLMMLNSPWGQWTTGLCLSSALIGARVPLSHSLIGFSDLYILSYIYRGGKAMKTANIFMSRHSHAVRVLKEFQLEGDEVKIQKQENVLVLRPKKKSWAALIESLKKFTDDFMAKGRRQPPLPKRGRAFA